VEKSLKWLEHIKYITNKGRKNLEFVMRNLKGASKAVKERAYSTMIRPILQYASSAWDPHLSRDVRELEKVQKRAARRVCGVYRNFVYDEVINKYEYPSVTKMVQELGWLPLVSRRQVSRLVNFHRVVHGQMGWASVLGVSRGVYHGRGDHTLKVERVGSKRDVGKYSLLPIKRVGSGTLSLRNWLS
jgi:hypothetical protein